MRPQPQNGLLSNVDKTWSTNEHSKNLKGMAVWDVFMQETVHPY
jgi:hypothetical protein